MTQNVYPELFDRVVRVNVATEEENVIAMVKYGIYKDYNPNRNSYICGGSDTHGEYANGDQSIYELHEYRRDYNLSREDILFEKEDIYPFIMRKIEEWYDKTPSPIDRIIQDQDSLINGGYLICLKEDSDVGVISTSIKYVYLNVGESYRNPYQVKNSNGWVLKQGSNLAEVLEGYYLFNDEDIKRLAEDFDALSRVK